MNQKLGFILFSTLMMTALVVPSSGSRKFAGQEKSGAGEANQSKSFTSGGFFLPCKYSRAA